MKSKTKGLLKIFAALALMGQGAYNSFLSPAIDTRFNYNHSLQSTQQVAESTSNYEVRKPGDYAIIAVGTGRNAMRDPLVMRGIQKTYDSLKKLGYSEESIIFLAPDVPAGRDINKGINARLNEENLRKALNYASKGAGNKGSITFFFEGHGDRAQDQSTLSLGFHHFSAEEFYNCLRSSNAKKILIFQQCYAGGFIDRLRTLDGDMTILAATPAEKRAISGEIIPQFWDRALAGQNLETAYKEASKEAGYTMSGKIAHFFSPGANQAVTYSRGNSHFPRNPKSAELEKKQAETSSNSSGLEKAVEYVFLISLPLFLIFSFIQIKLTGFAVALSENTTITLRAFFGLILLFSAILLAFFKIKSKIKVK